MSGHPVERALLLVRHGRTAANASGLLLGRADPPLDERGRRDAHAIGAAIASGRYGPIAAVVTSPLLRTRETGDHIRAALDTEPATTVTGPDLPRVDGVDERLIELDYGELDGVALRDVDPALWARWRADPAYAPPGGESLLDLGVRVRDACRDWSAASELPAGTIVLVSHVSPIKAAIAWALGVGDEIAWRMHLDTASISRIADRQGTPSLTSFNDTGHLSGD